jgi:hypothetical protein
MSQADSPEVVKSPGKTSSQGLAVCRSFLIRLHKFPHRSDKWFSKL